MKDRLYKIIEVKSGGSIRRFASDIGLPYTNIYNYYRKGKRAGDKITAEVIEKTILAFPDINVDWLLTGRGEMVALNNNEVQSDEKENIKNDDTNAVMERLKLISIDLGLSGREFSSSIGQSNSYLATEPKKGIRSDVLTKIIINYPQYNINWVLTGNGSMYISEPITSSETEKGLIEKLENAKEEVGYYKGILAALGIPFEPWKKGRSA